MTLRKPSTGSQPQGYKAVRKPPNERQGRKSGNSVIYSPDREHDYPLQIPRYERGTGLTPMQVRKLDVPITPEDIKKLKEAQYTYWIGANIWFEPPGNNIYDPSPPATGATYPKDQGPYSSIPILTTGRNFNTPPRYSQERFVNGVFTGIGESYWEPPDYFLYSERKPARFDDAYQFLYQSANSDKGYWICEVKSLPKAGTYPAWLRAYIDSQPGDPVLTLQCNCPDFARADYRYLSQFSLEVGQRNWSATDAGCDRAQGCKHVYATRLFLFEDVDLPSNEEYPTTPQL